LDAAEAADVPLALVAVTVNVYATPVVKPVTVIGDEPVAVIPPGLDVAVYVVTALPPVAPAVYATVAVVAVGAAAVPIVGASGTEVTVTALDAALVTVPCEFVEATAKVYCVEDVRPVTTNGDADPDAVKLPGVDVTT
jgi:hypothetical protein